MSWERGGGSTEPEFRKLLCLSVSSYRRPMTLYATNHPEACASGKRHKSNSGGAYATCFAVGMGGNNECIVIIASRTHVAVLSSPPRCIPKFLTREERRPVCASPNSECGEQNKHHGEPGEWWHHKLFDCCITALKETMCSPRPVALHCRNVV